MVGILNLDSEDLNGDSLVHCANLRHKMTALACFTFFRAHILKVYFDFGKMI